jgi:hypothetical protein
MSDILPYGEQEEEPSEPQIETTPDLRPDLAALGLQEHERGVVEDTYENRQVLRGAHMNWDPVYDQQGKPTGLISARTKEQTKERRVLALVEKKPLLIDPDDRNSEYVTGLDLMVDEAACNITPPWVVNATRQYLKEQENGGPTGRRAPLALPHRCRVVKSDGIRCMLWSSGRIKDDGLCRVHLRTQRKPGEDVERARKKLMQSAPYAVDVLEELMESAQSEPVRLKASSEILDRAGVRGGMDIGVDIEVTDARSPAQIVQERLARLAAGAERVSEMLGSESEIVDAEVVEENSKEDVEASGPVGHPNNSTDKDAAADSGETFTKFLPQDDGEEEDAAIQSDGFDEDELNV